eukprot:2989489-Rhodomonas_salina.1
MFHANSSPQAPSRKLKSKQTTKTSRKNAFKPSNTGKIRREPLALEGSWWKPRLPEACDQDER